jgi:hypothetical protein
MAEYTQPEYVEKRLRYFDGFFLKEQDFIDEQKYHIDRQRRHDRLLHSAGIADGLNVTKGTEPNRVTVSPGTAFDGEGRQILLASEQVVDVSAHTGTNNVLVYISFPANPEGGTPSDEATPNTGTFRRWHEQPEIATSPVDTAPPADSHIRLAKLNIAADGNVTIDNSVRVYAGLKLPAGPEISSGAAGRAVVRGPLRVSGDSLVDGDVGIGTVNPGAKLQIIGQKNPVPLRIGSGGGGKDFTMDIAAGEGLVSLVAGAQIKSDGSGYNFLGTRGASRIALHDGSIRFFTSDSTSGTAGSEASGLAMSQAKLVLTNDGNVGIGTTKPTKIAGFSMLTVEGDGRYGQVTAISHRDTDPAGVLKVFGSRGTVASQAALQNNDRFGLILAHGYNGASYANTASIEFKVDGIVTTDGLPSSIRFYTTKEGGSTRSERLVIKNDGNVGIGITNPVDRLQIGNAFAMHDGGHKVIGLGYTPATNKSLINGYPSAIRLDPSRGGIIFQTEATRKNVGDSVGGSYKMTIDKEGKVGIGIDDPGDKLTVKDGDIKIEGGRYRRLKIISDSYWAGIELVAREQGEAGNPHIDFTHGDLDAPNYGIRLYAPDNDNLVILGGKLGIAVKIPQETLDVSNRIKSGALTIGYWPANSSYVFFGTNALDQTNAGNYALLQQRTGTGNGRTYLNSPVDIRFRIGNVDKMVLGNDGKLTLHGQISKLDVANNFTATVRAGDFKLGHSTRRGSPGRALVDWKTGAGKKQLHVNYGGDWSDGARYWVSWKKASSRKLKENINALSGEEAYEILKKLNPVSFHLKKDKTRAIHLGFVAEDVHHRIASDDRKAVDNDHIVAVLTKIVKEQQIAISKLNKKAGHLEGL